MRDPEIVRLGREIESGASEPLPLVYVIRCIFCKREHRSPYMDEIEEEILQCRDVSPKWQWGALADFPDETRPIRVETQVAIADAEAASYNF